MHPELAARSSLCVCVCYEPFRVRSLSPPCAAVFLSSRTSCEAAGLSDLLSDDAVTRALHSGQLHGAIGSGAGGTNLGACESSRTGSTLVFLSCRSPASASLAGAVPSWPKAPTRLKREGCSMQPEGREHRVDVLCTERPSPMRTWPDTVLPALGQR